MKHLGWIAAGAGLGFAAYIVLSSPSCGYTALRGEVADAADKASLWGTKQRVKGTAGKLAGKVKAGLGNLTGDHGLAAEGAAYQAAGTVMDTAGKAANVVGDTVRELNR